MKYISNLFKDKVRVEDDNYWYFIFKYYLTSLLKSRFKFLEFSYEQNDRLFDLFFDFDKDIGMICYDPTLSNLPTSYAFGNVITDPGESNLNAFGYPTRYFVTIQDKYYGPFELNKNIVVTSFSRSRDNMTVSHLIRTYSKRLSEIFFKIDEMIRGILPPVIYGVTSNSYNNLKKTLTLDFLAGKEPSYLFNQSAPIVYELYSYAKVVLNQFLNLMGIKTITSYEKREHLITQEVSTNEFLILCNRMMYINSLQEFAQRVERVFGFKLTLQVLDLQVEQFQIEQKVLLEGLLAKATGKFEGQKIGESNSGVSTKLNLDMPKGFGGSGAMGSNEEDTNFNIGGNSNLTDHIHSGEKDYKFPYVFQLGYSDRTEDKKGQTTTDNKPLDKKILEPLIPIIIPGMKAFGKALNMRATKIFEDENAWRIKLDKVLKENIERNPVYRINSAASALDDEIYEFAHNVRNYLGSEYNNIEANQQYFLGMVKHFSDLYPEHYDFLLERTKRYFDIENQDQFDIEALRREFTDLVIGQIDNLNINRRRFEELATQSLNNLNIDRRRFGELATQSLNNLNIDRRRFGELTTQTFHGERDKQYSEFLIDQLFRGLQRDMKILKWQQFLEPQGINQFKIDAKFAIQKMIDNLFLPPKQFKNLDTNQQGKLFLRAFKHYDHAKYQILEHTGSYNLHRSFTNLVPQQAKQLVLWTRNLFHDLQPSDQELFTLLGQIILGGGAGYLRYGDYGYLYGDVDQDVITRITGGTIGLLKNIIDNFGAIFNNFIGVMSLGYFMENLYEICKGDYPELVESRKESIDKLFEDLKKEYETIDVIVDDFMEYKKKQKNSNEKYFFNKVIDRLDKNVKKRLLSLSNDEIKELEKRFEMLFESSDVVSFLYFKPLEQLPNENKEIKLEDLFEEESAEKNPEKLSEEKKSIFQEKYISKAVQILNGFIKDLDERKEKEDEDSVELDDVIEKEKQQEIKKEEDLKHYWAQQETKKAEEEARKNQINNQFLIALNDEVKGNEFFEIVKSYLYNYYLTIATTNFNKYERVPAKISGLRTTEEEAKKYVERLLRKRNWWEFIPEKIKTHIIKEYREWLASGWRKVLHTFFYNLGREI